MHDSSTYTYQRSGSKSARSSMHRIALCEVRMVDHGMVTPVNSVLTDLTRDCDTVGFVAMDTYCHMM